MDAPVKVDKREFDLIREYVLKSCGISLKDDKQYLVETRLTTLMVESGCRNFSEFYYKAVGDRTNVLRDKIVDAMTTNETLWFRDRGPYRIFEDVLLPQYAQEIAAGKRSKLRIWSAASSTGQEPYSIAITAMEYARTHPAFRPEQHLEIIATDISPTVLYIAMAGRYDNLAMSRGMVDDVKGRYFTAQGKVSAINDAVKKLVTFKKLNLQEPFSLIGKADLVFCRNVLIYFSDEFKRDVLSRIGKLLRPEGHLFLGASESIINYSSEFEMKSHASGLYYKVKP